MRGSFHLDVVNVLAALHGGVRGLSVVVLLLLLLLLLQVVVVGGGFLPPVDFCSPVICVRKKAGNRSCQCFDANASGLPWR